MISLEELAAARWVASLTDPTLLALYFEQADIDHSSGIDLDEFVLLNSFLFFLGDDAKAEAEGAPTPDDPVEVEIRFAFVAAASAFCCFDLNDDGVVERDEITTALGGPRGGGGAFITPERMEELDWDKNGTVSFKEFLLGGSLVACRSTVFERFFLSASFSLSLSLSLSTPVCPRSTCDLAMLTSSPSKQRSSSGRVSTMETKCRSEKS